MTHRPPNGLLVFFCQAISVSPSKFHVVVGAYVLAVYRQVCWPYCALQPCRTDVRQLTVLLVNSRASGTLAENMAAKAGWICSAGSSGSASSLRNIRCVWALSRYAVARPVEHQVIDRLVGFNHDNYRSIANGCWLITRARVYCQCGCPIYRHIHEEMVPDFFCKFTRKTHPCAQTILYRFRWQFQFRRVGLLARLIVGELVCRRVFQLPCEPYVTWLLTSRPIIDRVRRRRRRVVHGRRL